MKWHSAARARVVIGLAVSLLITGALSYWVAPPETRAFLNRIVRREIYGPVSDEFPVKLWEKGATATISFTTPFTNEYVVAVVFKEKAPPFFFQPQGTFLLRYYKGKTLVREYVYSNNGPTSPDKHGHARMLVLDTCVLAQEWTTVPHRIEFTVLDPDVRLEEYKDSLRVVVSGSPYW